MLAKFKGIFFPPSINALQKTVEKTTPICYLLLYDYSWLRRHQSTYQTLGNGRRCIRPHFEGRVGCRYQTKPRPGRARNAGRIPLFRPAHRRPRIRGNLLGRLVQSIGALLQQNQPGFGRRAHLACQVYLSHHRTREHFRAARPYGARLTPGFIKCRQLWGNCRYFGSLYF